MKYADTRDASSTLLDRPAAATAPVASGRSGAGCGVAAGPPRSSTTGARGARCSPWKASVYPAVWSVTDDLRQVRAEGVRLLHGAPAARADARPAGGRAEALRPAIPFQEAATSAAPRTSAACSRQRYMGRRLGVRQRRAAAAAGEAASARSCRASASSASPTSAACSSKASPRTAGTRRSVAASGSRSRIPAPRERRDRDSEGHVRFYLQGGFTF